MINSLHTNKRRGTLTFGMAALTLFLGVMCALVLLRSADIYRVSALTEARLQARAAAEGASVVLLANPAALQSEALEIGNCLVTFAAPADAKPRLVVPYRIDVHGKNGTAVFQANYTATFEREPAGRWALLGLEKLP